MRFSIFTNVLLNCSACNDYEIIIFIIDYKFTNDDIDIL